MTGSTTFLAVVLGTMTVASLTCSTVLVWKILSNQGRRSTSAEEMATATLSTMEAVSARATEIVRVQADLTETLLLGRVMPQTEPQPVPESPSEISVSPDDLWSGLPDPAKEAILRDREEAGTWPSPSEQLQHPSPNGWGPEEIAAEMRRQFT